KPGTISERDVRLMAGELGVLRFRRAEQNRDTAGIERAFDVDGGVADIPDRRPGGDAAAGERQVDGGRVGLVGGGVRGADEAGKIAGPAEMRGLAPQYRPGLVADDGEVATDIDQVIEQLDDAGQGHQ